jgi:PKD repeat protein
MGIYRVQLAGWDTTTAGVTDGYRDYSCTSGPTLQRNATYSLQVNTNTAADENVRAWIDFNNDGQLDATEQVLVSNAARQHTASFTVPATAVTGQPLRLRLAADYLTAPLPTACSTPQYSQTEDYRVLVSAAAPVRPQARFTALDSVPCGAAVRFRDQSLNSPAQWRWRFGDGSTSPLQHPQHVYAQPGTYPVQLQVCNATGCDSLTKTGFVTVLTDAPQPASCQPTTLAACCGFGLTRVRLGSLDQRSADGRVGYEDFSCAQRTTLTADQPVPLLLTTGPNAHDVRVYLDYNDNGQFDLPGEQLYQGLGVQSPSIVLQMGSTMAGLVYNRPLRLRIWADAAGVSIGGPCVSPQQGQVEDYTLTLLPNGAPPTAQFALTYTQWCGPTRIALTNATTGGATTYTWDFGDGTTSTAANPPGHTYSVAGAYEITLVVRNAFGADTLRQSVVVASNCPTYCAGGGNGGSSSAPAYFTRVQVGSLDNTDVRLPGVGYRDYTNRFVALQQGQTYPLRTESRAWTFSGNGPWVKVTAWLDANQDGNFSAAERLPPVVTLSPHLLSLRIPLAAQVGATRLRLQMIGTTFSPFLSDAYNACPPTYHTASTEDYTVLILPAAVAPRAGFQVNVSPSCNGTVQLRDTSWATPARWRWQFGDGSTSTQQHPLHTYLQPGTYTVSLSVANQYGADSLTRSAYVTISQLASAPRPAACQPPLGASLSTSLGTAGIDLIQVGGLSYNHAPAIRYAPYRDETCTQPPAQMLAGASMPITVRGLTNYTFQVRVWLDANDDGILDRTTELVYLAPQGSGTLTVPATVVRNRPLRLRVWWMANFGAGFDAVDGGSCFRSDRFGQVRDFTALVPAALASRSPQGSAGFSLFPNPSTGRVEVRSEQPLGGLIEVRNPLGQVVYTEHLLTSVQTVALDLQRLSSGVYFVHVPAQQLTRKLIVQH